MLKEKDVLFAELPGNEGALGIITLNRPAVLNSLNRNMVRAIYAQLKIWAEAEHIKAVIIKAAEGRAFCAGGDLRLTYELIQEKNDNLFAFFSEEYQLNILIYHFPKPYIALLDGITMGGGAGISIHGSHRIATDRLLFAMPEVGIGFFPDVGGTFFLPRLSQYLGFYLGLTGARINADDCVALKLVQQKVESQVLPEIIQILADNPLGANPKATVDELLIPFKLSPKPSTLLNRQTEINNCFSANTIEAILEALENCGDFGKEVIATFLTKSPTSLKVTLKALQQGKELDFDNCMQQEYNLARHFLEGHDFIEGIRALIIDKDQAPKWQPSTLAAIKQAAIEKYFLPF